VGHASSVSFCWQKSQGKYLAITGYEIHILHIISSLIIVMLIFIYEVITSLLTAIASMVCTVYCSHQWRIQYFVNRRQIRG